MKRGRTPLTLSLLGLGILVFTGFFVPTAHIYAQTSPQTETSRLSAGQAGRLVATCTKQSFTPTGDPKIDGPALQKLVQSAKLTTTNYLGVLSTDCRPINLLASDSKTSIGFFDVVCQEGAVGEGQAQIKYCDIKSKNDGSSIRIDKSYVAGAGAFNGTNAFDGSGNNIGSAQNNGDPSQARGVLKDNALAGAAAAEPDDGSCGITHLTACLVSGMAWIISEIEWLILAVATGILGLANYLLGWSTYVTVFQFGNLVGNSAGLLAAWGVMRDVANIVLLFGFIFLGVSTILNLPHSEYTAKKAIPSLIIFALLLNFSLFAVEAVIDVSNALATSIYEQATPDGVCKSNPDGVVAVAENTLDCIFKQGIGGQVMAMSGMANIYGFGSGENEAANGGNVQLVVVYAGLIIFAVITTLVLFAAAIMLIIRAVVLAFLMVTAPIGFAGMAIPPLHEMASRWWKELISQALFAPVYFLLALLSLKIMSGVMTALGTNSTGASRETLAGVFTAASDGGARGSNITIVMTFALIIGFMIAALMFAKKSSAMGTSIAMSGAGKLAFGSLGFVGRNTAGRFSYRMAERLKATSFGQTSRLGFMTVKALDKGSKASFDARGAGIGKGIAGAAGTAQRGGYAGIIHTAEDERKKYAEGLKNTGEDKKKIEDYQTRIENVNKEKDKDIEAEDTSHDAKVAALSAQIEEKQRESDSIVQPQRDRIKNKEAELASKQQALVEANQNGDQARIDAATSEVTTTEVELKSFEDALKAEEVRVGDGTKTIRAKIAEQNKAHGEVIGKINSSAKQQTEAFGAVISDIRKQPKLRYAETLHKRTLMQNTIGLVGGGVSATADHHAYEAIRRDVDKNDVQRMVDALNKASTPSQVHTTPTVSHVDEGHDDHK